MSSVAAFERGVGVIVPVYNEAGTIGTILDRLVEHPLVGEIIVVDDGSSDGSAEVVAGLDLPRVRLVRHAANGGKGRAIRTGLEEVTSEYVIIQDADLEYSPEDFERLLEPVAQGKADVVYGSRYLTGEGNRQSHGRFLDWGVRLLNVVTRWLYGLRLTDEATCYKVFRTADLKRMHLECERFEFCPEVTAKLSRMKLRLAEVPINYDPRGAAEGKKLRLRDGWSAIVTLWKHRRWEPGKGTMTHELQERKTDAGTVEEAGERLQAGRIVASLLMLCLVCCGCSQPTDADRFVVAEKRAREGLTTKFDVREFPRITDEDALRLAEIDTLEEINLDNAPISDGVVKAIAGGCPRLRSLSLTNTKVTDAGLEHLKNLTQLDFLRLDKTLVTDGGLRHVAEIPKLSNLSLWRCAITDAGVAHLKETGLHRLSLDGTLVSDKGLATIKEMGRLRKVQLAQTHVTEGGAAELKAARPGLEVSW